MAERLHPARGESLRRADLGQFWASRESWCAAWETWPDGEAGVAIEKQADHRKTPSTIRPSLNPSRVAGL